MHELAAEIAQSGRRYSAPAGGAWQSLREAEIHLASRGWRGWPTVGGAACLPFVGDEIALIIDLFLRAR